MSSGWSLGRWFPSHGQEAPGASIFSPVDEAPTQDNAIDDSGGIADQSEQYGLFPISVPDEESLQATDGIAYAVDFVAVHGLGGDAYRTWTHQNSYIWLRLISERIPGARVYSYGYDSGFAFSRGTGRVEEFARSLLEYIRTIRRLPQERDRALVFICHSMGGLVVKQAFLIANNEAALYPGIKESIPSILFLGTPHRGSNYADYADILGTIVKVFISGTQASRVVGSIRTDLLDSLKSGASDLERIAREFRIHTGDIEIASFIEQSTMQGLNARIVDEKSGVVGAARERIVSMIGYDHRGICKHSSSQSQGLSLIMGCLQDAAEAGRIAIHPREQTTLILTESSETQKNKSLLQASRTGVIPAAMRLLENGADLHAYDEDLRTPLHLAAFYGHLELVRYLTAKKQANVNEEDTNRMSPLHLAAKIGNGQVTDALLAAGASVTHVDKDGFTALHWAAISGDEWTVYHLLRHGGDAKQQNNLGDSPIRLARRNGNVTVMKRLQGLIDPPTTVPIPTATVSRASFDSGNSFLSNITVIHWDPDWNRPKEDSPLYRAAASNDLKTLEDLLDEGHQPTAESLHIAAQEGYPEIVKALVDLVPDIDAPVGWVGNALSAAAASMRPWDSIKSVEILLKKGADVNWQGGFYGSPLQVATANYRLEIVKLLLEYGGDVHAQCGHYGNALTAAARHHTHFKEMAQMFLDRSVDIDAEGPGVYGNPLQTACWIGHEDNVRFLLDHGANKHIKGRFGSAEDIALKGTRFKSFDDYKIRDLIFGKKEIEELGMDRWGGCNDQERERRIIYYYLKQFSL